MTDTQPPCKLISAAELEQLAPGLYAGYRSRPVEEDEEEEDNTTFLYFDGDVRLTGTQYDSLKNEYGFYTPWAVNGNLTIEGDGFGGSALVKGDLLCDCFGYGECVYAGGKVVARYYAAFIAEDHEQLCSTTALRLETPHVFAWFYNLQQVQLSPGTCVFVLCDGSDLAPMGLKDPWFYWEESAFVLKPAFCYTVSSHYSDAMYWNLNAIETALQKDQSLFIDGFTVECMSLFRQTNQLLRQKNYREAYKTAQQVADLAPGFYYPLYHMGYSLYHESAFEQAIPVLQEAVKRFPEKCRNLQNQAADYLAMAALRLRRLDMAMEWSSFSIESTRNNKDDGKRQWFAYRIRGEVHILKGDPEAAGKDLETAVNLNFQSGSAHWLLGLAYHQSGAAKEAVKHHGLAVKLGSRFAATYDTHHNTDFLQAPPASVHWA